MQTILVPSLVLLGAATGAEPSVPAALAPPRVLRAEVSLAAPKVSGHVSAERVAEQLAAPARAGVERCVMAAVPDKGDTSSTFDAWVTVRLSLGADGVVRAASGYESAPFMPELEECVAQAWVGGQGPALSKGKAATVLWTMNLKRV